MMVLIKLDDCVKVAVQMLLAGENSSGPSLVPLWYEGELEKQPTRQDQRILILNLDCSSCDWRGLSMFDKKDEESIK